MSKLSEALKLLDDIVYNNTCMFGDTEMATLRDAQAELLELQRMQSVVKEFIATNDIDCICDEIYDENRNVSKLLSNLCNIVGYSE